MSLEPLTTRQLTAAFFGWLSTGFGTWLLIPAWWSVFKGPEDKIEPTTAVYFASWLAGDGLHLTALFLEKVGWQTYTLYVIVAGAEIIILFTLMWKAHLFCCCQKPLPKRKTRSTTTEISGFMLIPVVKKRKQSKRICGMSPMFWKVFWTMASLPFFHWCALWYLFSYKRVAGLPEPKPSSWPHDLFSQLAFAFGVLGFFCWSGPRVYVLYKKRDDISTSSVVLGVGAHSCNMINIATLNFVTPGNAAASSPFFLTSLVCIALDIVRLYRKTHSPKVLQLSTNMAATVGYAVPSAVKAINEGLRAEGEGTREQRQGVFKRIQKFETHAEEVIHEMEEIEYDLRIRGTELEETLRKRWIDLCRGEGWDPADGSPLQGRRRLYLNLQSLDDQASALEHSVKFIMTSDSKEYSKFRKQLRATTRKVGALKKKIIEEQNNLHENWEGRAGHSPLPSHSSPESTTLVRTPSSTSTIASFKTANTRHSRLSRSLSRRHQHSSYSDSSLSRSDLDSDSESEDEQQLLKETGRVAPRSRREV
ncbi:hypothetical protein JCM3765_001060 [Sporobolomyces pararoseus]